MDFEFPYNKFSLFLSTPLPSIWACDPRSRVSALCETREKLSSYHVPGAGLHNVNNISFKLYDLNSTKRIGTNVIILQMRTLTFKLEKYLIQDHTNSQYKSQDSTPGLPTQVTVSLEHTNESCLLIYHMTQYSWVVYIWHKFMGYHSHCCHHRLAYLL